MTALPCLGGESWAVPQESNGGERSFAGRGLIQTVSNDRHSVVVQHDDIPGLMPKMTMDFTVRNTNELRGLEAGDEITFQLEIKGQESWIQGLQRVGKSMLPQSPTLHSKGLAAIGTVQPGDLLPDAEMIAEDGRKIRLSDFEGRAVAFTFIFTRCPLPDFCPRMNQNFNEAHNLLRELENGPTNWQFLSISFDAKFDRPAVLASYAEIYRGTRTEQWLFAAAETNALAKMKGQLDFRFATEGGSFVHNLRTVVLDTHRRLYRQFDGNKWKAEELTQAIVEAAAR